MKTTILTTILVIFSLGLSAQVSVNTDGSDPDGSAMLDVKSTDKGMLVPRIALVNTSDPISGMKPEGLLVWNTSTTGNYPEPGFYYWNGSEWIKISVSGDVSSMIKDADGDTKVLVEENADEDKIRFYVEGTAAMIIDNNGNVGIGTDTPESSALLEVKSTDKGFLPPRMTEAQRDASSSAIAGLVVWCTNCGTNGELQVYNGTAWTNMTGGAAAYECGNDFTDARDSKTYSTVLIGTQCWMKENLNYDQSAYGDDWCYYGDASYCDTYGRLYNWAAVMQGASASNCIPSGVQGVCPDGWHVPGDAEWMILEEEVESTLGVNWNASGYRGTDAGKNLKTTSGWYASGNGTDQYGFGALPGGLRGSTGIFKYLGEDGFWWSTSEPWDRNLNYQNDGSARWSGNIPDGFSVRCLRE